MMKALAAVKLLIFLSHHLLPLHLALPQTPFYSINKYKYTLEIHSYIELEAFL